MLTDDRLRDHRSESDPSHSSDESASPDVMVTDRGYVGVHGIEPVQVGCVLADAQRPPFDGQLARRGVAGANSQADLLGSITLPGQPEHVRLARHFTAGLLGGHEMFADTAILLVSELVSNSVLHSDSRLTGGMVTVTLIGVPGGIRVEVSDQGSATVPSLTTGPKAAEPTESGRGLLLVEQLSARWGIVSASRCMVTWFELMGMSQ